MNYLAHGRLLVDVPWAMAGAAVPDWLKIADRRARVLPERLPAEAARSAEARDLVAGILRHHDDDARFHACAAFVEATDDVTARIRAAFPDEKRLRASFLAHLMVEMLLDAWIEREEPGTLERYYRALDEVDPALLGDLVGPLCARPVPRLPDVVRFFRASRFLYGYETDEIVADRLAGVSRRMGLAALPPSFPRVVAEARSVVDGHAAAMLGG